MMGLNNAALFQQANPGLNMSNLPIMLNQGISSNQGKVGDQLTNVSSSVTPTNVSNLPIMLNQGISSNQSKVGGQLNNVSSSVTPTIANMLASHPSLVSSLQPNDKKNDHGNSDKKGLT